MIEKLKEGYRKLVEQGILLPLFRDPKSQIPSISFTLLIVSFLYASIAIGLHIAKATDNTSSALDLFYGCCALYFGRSITTKSGTVINKPDDTKVE